MAERIDSPLTEGLFDWEALDAGDKKEGLEGLVLRECVNQLRGGTGKIWLTGAPLRALREVGGSGSLQDFLEDHPDIFRVHPEGGRKFWAELR